MKKFFILGLAVVLIAAGVVVYLLTRTQPQAATIVIDQPVAGAHVSSPLTVTGKARGSWYFEAVFPVVLTNAAGTVIAQTQAHAQSDWMTTDFVPFTATITFASQPSGTHGVLTLKKDNPSGLPANDDSRTIQVIFK